MKLTILIFALCLEISAHAQDSLKYDYALVKLSWYQKSFIIKYDDGQKDDLVQKFKLTDQNVNDYDGIFFRTIQYLNDKGYELIATHVDHGYLEGDSGEKGLLFKRKKMRK
jgi:hypothetical protein